MNRAFFGLVVIAIPCAMSSNSLGSDGGAELRVSASATDPEVATSPPTGEIRPLYLWMTCAGYGVTAIAAMTGGSLAPLAFVPSPGVLNVGSASELLLAVPGCPYGDEVEYLLGTWYVLDEGGDLCLNPTGPDGYPIIVDCIEPNPGTIENVVRFGFSSTPSSPCVLGLNGCESLGGVAVESLTWGKVKAEYR